MHSTSVWLCVYIGDLIKDRPRQMEANPSIGSQEGTEGMPCWAAISYHCCEPIKVLASCYYVDTQTNEWITALDIVKCQDMK